LADIKVNSLEELKQMFLMSELSLLKYMVWQMRELGRTVIEDNGREWAYSPGDGDICLVAHTDTVQKDGDKSVFFDADKKVFWSPAGLGADDRAGVFGILQLIRRQPNFGVILCTGEEKGAIGARSFMRAYPTNSGNYKVLVELDRRGDKDAVFYDNDSKEFHEWVEQFGFKKCWGSFSDISVIAPRWEVNAVNLSVGYVSEHTKQEHLFVKVLFKTLNKVLVMSTMPVPDIKYEEHVYRSTFHHNSTSYHYANGYDYYYNEDYYTPRRWDKQKRCWVDKEEEEEKSTHSSTYPEEDCKWCSYCYTNDIEYNKNPVATGRWKTWTETTPNLSLDEGCQVHLCPACQKIVTWCGVCEDFVPVDKSVFKIYCNDMSEEDSDVCEECAELIRHGALEGAVDFGNRESVANAAVRGYEKSRSYPLDKKK